MKTAHQTMIKNKAFEELSTIEILNRLRLSLRLYVDYVKNACECIEFTKDMLKEHLNKKKTSRTDVLEIGCIFNFFRHWLRSILPAEIEFLYREPQAMPDLSKVQNLITEGVLLKIAHAVQPYAVETMLKRLDSLGSKFPSKIKNQLKTPVPNLITTLKGDALKLARYVISTAVISKKTGELRFVRLSRLTFEAVENIQKILPDASVTYCANDAYIQAVLDSKYIFRTEANCGKPVYNIMINNKKPLKAWYASDDFQNMQSTIEDSLQFYSKVEA